jgi:imidazole glycerol-phosphate synthase subunit HisH
MTKQVVIIDYSLGNLFSVEQAFRAHGANLKVSHDPRDIESADGVVLPGVGAFGEAMRFLSENGLDKAIRMFVEKGGPFLGICLGMQLLFETSDEFGDNKGLGLIKGTVKKFRPKGGEKLIVPHVGWNTINAPKGRSWDKTIFAGVPDRSYMYFVHSYYCAPESAEVILSQTEYAGIAYCSALEHRNLAGTQFHPEKSGSDGLAIYKNWLSKL